MKRESIQSTACNPWVKLKEKSGKNTSRSHLANIYVFNRILPLTQYTLARGKEVYERLKFKSTEELPHGIWLDI